MLSDVPQLSLLHALAPFLNHADGVELSIGVGSQIAGALNVTRDEAAALHRELVCEHFSRFVRAALQSLKAAVSPEVLDGVFDELYGRLRLSGRAWVPDLDVGEHLSTAPELVQDALGSAASDLLHIGNTRFCMRRVLQETLSRIETNRADSESEPE